MPRWVWYHRTSILPRGVKKRGKENLSMQWTTPEYKEITLCMEVTAYVNTDEQAA